MATCSEKIEPVRCGCGGEAFTHILGNEIAKGYYIACDDCGTKTKVFGYEAEAITAWNRAIGAKDINVPNKERTAKVEVLYRDESVIFGHCECGQAVNTYGIYCHKCGARLIWGEE